MKVSIVGAGRVGTTLAAAISAAGHELTAVVSRSQASAEAATALAGTGRASIDLTHAFAADLLLLTVPDDQIGGVARRLDEAGCPETLGVCHTSGACSSELLAPLPRRASAHPLQTFAEARSALKNLPGTYWALEGDTSLLPQLEQLVTDLDCRPLHLRTEQKVLYHAGAVVACNYLSSLASIASRLLAHAGIAPADGLAALLPLIQGTVNNLEQVGLPDALTGPISRGDRETISRHLADLPSEFQAIYRLLGREAVALAERQGQLPAEVVAQLRELLS